MGRPVVREFIEYVGSLRPAFMDSIQGATAEEVQLYEQLVGRQLPPTYREFLLAMGHENGGTELFVQSTTDVRQLIEVYRTEVQSGETVIPPRCVLMAIDELEEHEVFLEGPPDEEPRVVLGAGGRVTELYAESLGKLLFRYAFVRDGMAALPHHRYYSGGSARDRVLPKVRDLATSLGFEPLWFSDSLAFCGQGEGASVYCDQMEGRGLAFKVTARKEAEAEKIGAEFARRFLLDPQTLPKP
ncbi:MAG: SMI1/KNR4 family protein [Candidatus Riflebacteria bacterium]|nr:SMI1/KNR4 family protein [Candidatus Riflebacteria bacterium]